MSNRISWFVILWLVLVFLFAAGTTLAASQSAAVQ